MKLSKLVREFSVNDTRWVECPFVKQHLEFEIYRIGHEAFAKRVRERQRKNPTVKMISNVSLRLAAVGKDKHSTDLQERILKGIDVDKAMEEMGDQLANDEQKRDVAEALVRNWRGEVVEDVPYSPDECFEMLSDDAPLGLDFEVGHRDGCPKDDDCECEDLLTLERKQSLGDALSIWLQWEANQQEKFRETWIEDQAKNSAGSSVDSAA